MSCIDLIFWTNQSVISNHGVDVSIFDKCHRNIIYSKIIICVPLPPTYVREFWDHKKANIENIKKSISNFDWNKAFEILPVDEKVDVLNKTLLNIFRNYISNKKKLNVTAAISMYNRQDRKLIIFFTQMVREKLIMIKLE